MDKNFDSFKLYIIRCYDNKESFIKIGKTFGALKERFRKFPYKTEVIGIVVGSARYISDMEVRALGKYKGTEYHPLKKMDGCNECFSAT